jgi:cytochrome c-type biogenesis protein CcmH
VTAFVIACGALILFSALFYSFPRRRNGDAAEDLEQANLDWFRRRRAELDTEGDDALLEDARLRLLEDEQAEPAAAPPTRPPGRGFPRWLLLPLVACASVLLYYRLGSAPDVLIREQLESLGDNTTPEQMAEIIGAIEERSGQRPENLHYLALLGRYYMGQQAYAGAADVYTRLAEKVPEDAQSLAYAAQAQYLARGRQLDDSSRLMAERALAVDPHQRTALGLLGMASFEQGQYRAAIDYWQRLLAMEPPGSDSARMIAGVIDSARARLGESPAVVAAAETAPTAGAGITVQVSLPSGAQIPAGDTVFVLARNAESESRMPIAVRRLQAGQLPVTLRLDDSNSMAGQKLSETESVLVLVQVSPEGRPGEANATWLGRAGPLAPALDGEPLRIVLSPRES